MDAPDLLVFPKFSWPAQATPGELADQMLECGVDGVDVMIRKTSWVNEDDYFQTLPSFLEAMRARGLKAYAVTTDWTHAKLPEIEDSYKLFSDCGVKLFRFLMQTYRGRNTYHADIKECRRSVGILEGLGRRYGVKALLQTHGDSMTWSPEAAFHLLNGVDPETVGVHYDPGNMRHQEGWTDPVKAVDILGPHLAYVVAKNCGWFMVPDRERDQRFVWRREWTRMPHGMIDWPFIFKELRAANYQGPICMHNFYEKSQEGLVEGTKIDAQYIRGMIRDNWGGGDETGRR